MRLDKYLSLAGVATRSETARAVRAGEVFLNGTLVKRADTALDPDTAAVVFRGQPVVYRTHTYIMMHKPDGVVSATQDGRDETVLDLLPDEWRRIRPPLFPCGRLDKHTTGLMLLTNNGELSHKLLSPARHVDKTYAFTVKFPLSVEDKDALEAGVDIGGYVTAPCRVEPLTDDGEPMSLPSDTPCRRGLITLHEGKYHQIKLMMEAQHNQITSLRRETFGPLVLDPSLTPGEWRLLTDEEINAIGG